MLKRIIKPSESYVAMTWSFMDMEAGLEHLGSGTYRRNGSVRGCNRTGSKKHPDL